VIEWRLRRLEAAGFDPFQARRLAGDFAYDLHAVIELVEQGCPPGLAVRIVAPLEGGDQAA
jgi:uncharacterized Fe-S cluster-containing radical SAM superfamily enzyme